VIRTAFAPGRVNLIGDHTDYTGGLVLPMAIQLGTTVRLESAETLELRVHSTHDPDPVTLRVDGQDSGTVVPEWGRYVAGVVAQLHPTTGGQATVVTTLPVGAGLASSAALELAVALALGAQAPPLELALLCQRAEQAAVGVPCGIMDQLASAAGVAGHALLIDCTTNVLRAVALPEDVEVVAVHCGRPRVLAATAYAERRASCESAARSIGPLRDADLRDLAALPDDQTRRRARHVITENTRTAAFADALEAGRSAEVGQLMAASHRSLRDDFDVVPPVLDALVGRLSAIPGVYGARMTGAGFGGCAVALCAPGALLEGWRLDAVGPARVITELAC